MKKFILFFVISLVFLINASQGVQAAPTITVLSPNGGESWAQGSTQNITWTFSEVSDPVDIYLYKDDGSFRDIALNEPCDGSYTWNIPSTFPVGTTYQVVIQGTGAAFWASDRSDNYFSITGTPPPTGIPHINNISPASGPSNTLITIEGSNFNPDTSSNFIGFCDSSICVSLDTWSWVYPAIAANNRLTVNASYAPAGTVLTIIVESITVSGRTRSDNSANFTITEACPFTSTKCECVPDVLIEGGCIAGHCSSFCGTFAGNICSNDVDCTVAGQCNLPNKCGAPCLEFGSGWTPTEGICPIGKTCCAPPGTPPPGTPLPVGGIIEIKNPITATSFEAIVGNGIDFVFKITIVLAPLMVVIGGFLLLTAGGNISQVGRAKSLLLWTAIGFLVVLLSKGILAIINQILGVRGG